MSALLAAERQGCEGVNRGPRQVPEIRFEVSYVSICLINSTPCESNEGRCEARSDPGHWGNVGL